MGRIAGSEGTAGRFYFVSCQAAEYRDGFQNFERGQVAQVARRCHLTRNLIAEQPTISLVGTIDIDANADIMSDMRTFTVRDLDRSPSTVLDASRLDGRVRIRERGGQTYIITPEVSMEKPMTDLPDFAKRRKRTFGGVLSPSTVQQLDKAISGE